MNITIHPSTLSGTIQAIPSKSQAHRLLICAAFSDKDTTLHCPQTNQDIEATAECLKSLGAHIQKTKEGYYIQPIRKIPTNATLNCHESGSTLRFLLPICCALGVDATIRMSGHLPNRPLSPLWEELVRMGAILSRPTFDTIRTAGRLCSGDYNIPGNISSQFISGLLFATALMPGDSKINISGNIESLPYIQMTQNALTLFGVATDGFTVKGSFPFHSPEYLEVEGDWSNSAFFLTANLLGSNIKIENLDSKSAQGDRAILMILSLQESTPVISAANIPDLVPILSIAFASRNGAIFTDIQRLRLKESDRVQTTCSMLRALGIPAEASESTLIVGSGNFKGCTIDAKNDHRIAMSAAIAATITPDPVTIVGAECVAKSYPSFWDEYKRLGGYYEQYLW